VSQDAAGGRSHDAPAPRHKMPPAGGSVRSSSDAPGGSGAISTAAPAPSSGGSSRPRSGGFPLGHQGGGLTGAGATTPRRSSAARSASARTGLKPTTPAFVAV